MGNKLRGFIDFEVRDTSYRIAFTTNALCEWEEMTGQSIKDLTTSMSNPTIKMMRSLLWAGLRDFHPEVSLKDVGDIIDEVGVPVASSIISKAFSVAFPENKKESGKTNGNPMKAKTKGVTIGTG
jgi:hypothetical protein